LLNRTVAAIALILSLAACALRPGPNPSGWSYAPPPPSSSAAIVPNKPSGAIARSTPRLSAPAATNLRGRIAYGDQHGHLWVVNADGSGARQVTSATSGIDFDPSWLSDGRTLVFRTSRGHYASDTHGIGSEGIWLVDTVSLREHQLFPPKGSTYGGLFPDAGPNSLVVLTTLDKAQDEDLIIVNAKSDQIVRHLNAGDGECEEWSPNGKQIAYCHHGGAPFDVWVMNADGSHQTRLTDAPDADYPGPWSPDSRRLCFQSRADANPNIYVMNADGTNKQQITALPGAEAPEVWLPDGRIVFDYSAAGAQKPSWFLINPDGTGLASIPWFDTGDVEGPIDWLSSP
jgi:hypothetical protein